MIKIKKIKIIAEMNDGTQSIILEENYNNAIIDIQRDYRHEDYYEVIMYEPTNNFHITIKEVR